jgi:phosphatidate cytidylyltransferase
MAISKKSFSLGPYLNYTWMFLLSIVIAEFVSFTGGILILALVSFWALREYLSLIDMRLQDRLGLLGAYLSVPFMYYFILIDWWGMFIVSIPVYSFLAIPLLVTLGGKETRGTVLSIGAIDFGLFLFVFCIGHIGYLMLYSTWKAAALIIAVTLCDVIGCQLGESGKLKVPKLLACGLIPMPFTALLMYAVSPWTEIPIWHSIILGLMIPPLVGMGHRTSDYVKDDLGILEDQLFPGRGRILDSVKSFFFTAPIVFHYIRYFLT